MYKLKKYWKGTDEHIYRERAFVLRKKNLPGRGLTKVEKHWSRHPVEHLEVNVKLALERATKDLRESRCIALLFL